jgi:hypothetical protein
MKAIVVTDQAAGTAGMTLTVSTLDQSVAAFNSTGRRKGKTIIRVRP